MSQRCGYVAVIGAPNAGKSTLVNQLVGSKVSIVSPKVQTTRNRILGIALKDDTQVVLVDTPGVFFNPKRRLEKAMVQAAWSSLEDADAIALVIDTSKAKQADATQILEQIAEHGKQLILVLNKVDIAPKERLLELAQQFQHPTVKHTFMISALTGDGVQDLLTFLADAMPQGIWLFPEDQLSDLPQRMLAAEITREAIFHRMHQELPYSIMVETEFWEEFDNGDVKISQIIYVQRDSQKGMVVGKGGQQIRTLGSLAREEMTQVFERKVHLNLRVKVKEDWMDRPQHYRMLGLDYDVR